MKPGNNQENRISVVDGLRGFAVITIALLHNVEHFNLTVFPVSSSESLHLSDQIIDFIVRSLSSGKSYGIFALLFGFTFHLQYRNQMKHGHDFKYRFMWRMILLFTIGTINSAFYSGEILVLYSILGLILIPLRNLKNKTLIVIAAIFMLQPVLMAKIAYFLFLNPDFVLNSAPYSADPLTTRLVDNSFFEMLKTNMFLGRHLYWAILLSSWVRIFQTASLFIIGMMLGRERLFENAPNAGRFWKKTLIISLLSFIILEIAYQLTEFIKMPAIYGMVRNALSTWINFAFIMILVSLFVKIYSGKFKAKLKYIESFGIMSLTNYLIQSILGSFLYYGYGLFLAAYCGVTWSFLIGIFILFLQWLFCRWWLDNHEKGPTEQLWHNLTWIKSLKIH